MLFGLFFAIIGSIVRWKFGAPGVSTVLWIGAAVIVTAYYAVPPMRRPLYLGWMYGAMPIGWTVTHVMLALIYYLLFTPIGLIMRALGRDSMERRIDRQAKTYWIEHRPGKDVGRYFRQF